MGTERAIGHLDSDCFYVSAERVRDDFLLNKPVAVLGNQGACVIAKSYEMKARGVKTGEPIWEAMEKCPDGVYLKRDFRWYDTEAIVWVRAVFCCSKNRISSSWRSIRSALHHGLKIDYR
jgi:hypothetical protein